MIKDLIAQLTYDPTVKRPRSSVPSALVIGGMGGSALAGDMLAFLLPERHIIVHRSYGLPVAPSPDALYIAISHSGNTEETISFANEAMKCGYSLAIVAGGGTLASFAEREGLPLALVPAAAAPRYSLLSMVRALLALLQEKTLLTELGEIVVAEEDLASFAEEDAHFLLPSVPLFYASPGNACLAYTYKIMLNETARMPAFMNVFPELNHNEMQSFDTDMPEGLEHLFRFVLIRTDGEEARLDRRMDTFTSLMEERGKMVHMIELPSPRASTLVSLWMRSILAARALAETRGIDSGTQPLVDAFKKLL